MHRIRILVCTLFFASLSLTAFAQVPTGDIADYEEKVEALRGESSLLVINFWATWCKPCVMEMPHLLENREKYKDENVKFLFVSLDFARDLERKLIPFVEERGMTEDTYFLEEELGSDDIDVISPEWSGAIPVTIYYSDDEKYVHGGVYESAEEVSAEIESYLK